MASRVTFLAVEETMSRMGTPRRLALARWCVAVGLGGLALFVAGSTAYWQSRSTFAIPYWDQWSAVYDYFRFRSGQVGFDRLFAQSNEHRIFFPRLIMFADLWLFGGRNAFNVVTSDTFQIAHLSLLLWMGRASLRHSFVGWTTAAFVTTAMLTGSQYENIYWGFQSQFVMVFLFASLALAAAASVPRRRGSLPRAALLSTALLSALVATFSMANGLIVWPLLALTLIARRAGWKPVAAVAAVGGVATAFYLHGYASIATHTPLTAALRQPVEALSYFFAYLGALVTPQAPWAACGFGIALAILLMALASRQARRGAVFDAQAAFLWGVALFVLLSAAVTTLGRFEFGIVQALSPRYITPDAVLWSATVLLTLKEFRETRTETAGMLLAISCAALTGWLALVDQPLSFDRMADHETKMIDASDAVIAGVTDAAALAALGPSPEGEVEVSALLKAHDLSLFASREAGWMGGNVARLFTVVDDPSCVGSVDLVQPLGPEGRAGVEVTGWAWVGGEQRGPAELVFTDERGMVVGLAHGRMARPDVPAAMAAVASDRVGFHGFLSPTRGSALSAYAVTAHADEACRIGG